jgi:hypothetical protein
MRAYWDTVIHRLDLKRSKLNEFLSEFSTRTKSSGGASNPGDCNHGDSADRCGDDLRLSPSVSILLDSNTGHQLRRPDIQQKGETIMRILGLILGILGGLVAGFLGMKWMGTLTA